MHNMRCRVITLDGSPSRHIQLGNCFRWRIHKIYVRYFYDMFCINILNRVFFTINYDHTIIINLTAWSFVKRIIIQQYSGSIIIPVLVTKYPGMYCLISNIWIVNQVFFDLFKVIIFILLNGIKYFINTWKAACYFHFFIERSHIKSVTAFPSHKLGKINRETVCIMQLKSHFSAEGIFFGGSHSLNFFVE